MVTAIAADRRISGPPDACWYVHTSGEKVKALICDSLTAGTIGAVECEDAASMNYCATG